MSATAASAPITTIQNPAAVSIIDRGGAVCGSSWYGVPRVRSDDHLDTSFRGCCPRNRRLEGRFPK